MNLTTLFRDHPDLAMLLDDAREHLVQCGDCPHHFPPDQLYHGGDRLLCATCFDRRQDAAWDEWCDGFDRIQDDAWRECADRMAKEGEGSS